MSQGTPQRARWQVVVPNDPAVLDTAQNITALKIRSSSSFSTSHITRLNSLLAALLSAA